MVLQTLGVVAGVLVIALFLFEAFEAMVLTRRVSRPFRLTVYYYRTSWAAWATLARRLPAGKPRDNFLALFGPLSILALIALWIVGLITGFALLHRSLGTPLNLPPGGGGPAEDFGTYLYLSGVTFFTVGYGDFTAARPLGRFLTVAESGTGFMFLAVSVGYLPVFYSVFSRREVFINLLDARAGSPPGAGQLLLRVARARHTTALNGLLADGERWAAELLEGTLSYPLLAYYRSQHDNQSWLAALATLLDACALLITAVKDADAYQAQLTFAMARHAAVDLALVFGLPPRPADADRLPGPDFDRLRAALREAGMAPREGPAVTARLAELRATYEPFLVGLSAYFLFPLPPPHSEKQPADNWQTSAWMRRTAGIGRLPGTEVDDHE